MNDIIRVKDVVFFYNNEFSIQKVSFSVKKGEFLGIIGPNGSGKTTLLRLITGFLSQKEGDIFLKGKYLHEWTPQERAKIITVVPQDIYTFFNFKVREIVFLGRLPYRNERDPIKDERIVRESMEKADVLRFSNRRFFSLSGGERQRVLIAKSFAQDTEVLLLDEFTSHLDLYHQKSIIDILNHERKKKKLTIIATFHDINLASILSDKLIIFKNGQILAEGYPKDIINKDNIKRAYFIDPIISPHPKYDVPQIFYS